MVKVTFKLSDTGTVSLDIAQPEKLGNIIKKAAIIAGVKLGGFIAVRNDKVVTTDGLIGPDDEIDVFPAISGG